MANNIWFLDEYYVNRLKACGIVLISLIKDDFHMTRYVNNSRDNFKFFKFKISQLFMRNP